MEALAGLANPFRKTIVTDPWQAAGADVPEIHARAYRLCCEALDSVRAEGQSSSVLMHGEAGSGKTHLLSRLRARWTETPPRDIDPIWPDVVFVAVKLQTGPQRLWRYLRRSFVEDLLRTAPDGTTQLERILLRRLAEIRPADADLRLWWLWLQEEHPDPADLERTLVELFGRLDQSLHLGRDLGTVLRHLILDRHLLDARAWLLGDPLPDAALESLGVAVVAQDDDQEDQARRMVLALCKLAGPRIPVVLCFDQIEALQVDQKDDTPLFALGQLVMALFNQTDNVLIISCIQSAYVNRLQRSVGSGSSHVSDPAWDRMAVRQIALNPLRWEEAVQLAKARMESLPALAKLRAAHPDPLWPLDAERLRRGIPEQGETARRILSRCAELFDLAAHREPPRRLSAEQFLARTWQERFDEAARGDTLTEADLILSHGLPHLVQAAPRGGWTTCSDPRPKDIDVLLHGPDGRVGISLYNNYKLNGAHWQLKRLNKLLRGPQPGTLEKVVILRDARLPIPETATEIRKHLEHLQEQGARLLRPSAEAMAALQALRGLLSDARAGDLANGGETVGPRTVEEWVAKNLPPVLEDLLEEITKYPGIGGERDGSELLDRLMEMLGERPVVALEEVAEGLRVPVGEVEACVRANPQHVGFLAGPPAVAFRLVAEGVEVA